MNVLSLPIKVGMWWRGSLCQPWPASISLVWLCGGGASQGVRCPLHLHSLFRAKSCMRPVGGLGGHDISQSTKPLPLSSEEHNRAKMIVYSASPNRRQRWKAFWVQDAGQGPRTEATCLTRPPNFDKCHGDCCYTCSHFYYPPATLLGPDYPQPNQATWGSFNAVPQATCRRAPTPAPGVVLWFWHPASSWVPAPSHGLIMRLNWWFSLIFASFRRPQSH